MAWLGKFYTGKVIKNQSNEKTSLRPRSKRVDGAQSILPVFKFSNPYLREHLSTSALNA